MTEKIPLINTDQLPKYEEGSWLKLALEAVSTCPKIKKEREIKIIADRFGLGKKPKTLHAIGTQYNLTRERIRQIVNNSVKKVKLNCVSKELKKRISEIERYAESRKGVVSLDSLIKYFKISTSDDINALNFILNLSKKINPLKESHLLKATWVIGKVKSYPIIETVKKSTDLLKSKGNVLSSKQIADQLKTNAILVESILGCSKAVMQTEEGDWGLVSWPHVNPKSIRDKSRYILLKHKKPLHYSDLTEKIGTIGGKTVTKQSVHNELIKNQDFVLIGRGIYALSDWGYTPGVVEEVIVTVLEEAGEPLHKNEIIKRVREKRIVKDSTVVLNLQKNRFKRVSKAVYTIN